MGVLDNVQVIPANPGNYGASRNAGQIKYLVYHYTGNDGDTATSNGNYFKTNVVEASAHYFVDDDTIVQSVDDLKVAWAVGGTKWSDCASTGGGTMYGLITNTNSLSIEMCDTTKDGTLMASEATQALAIELGKALMEKYNIPVSNVYRHFDVTGKHCVPCDCTELLTKKGWVNIKNVEIGDEVAQYNTKDNNITFGAVLDKVDPYEATVYRRRGLEATADHRMWMKPNCINSHEFREIKWGDAIDGHRQYIVKNGAVYNGMGLELTDDELRLLVWIQGDGHYMKNKAGEVSGLEFHLKKERKIARIKGILDALGVTYTISKKTDGSVSLRHYSIDIVEWAEKWLDQKKFTYAFLEMTPEQFDVFWAELLVVDGSVEGNLYSSIPEQNLDVVQAVCATKGARTNKCSLGKGYCDAILRTEPNYSIGWKTKDASERVTEVSCVTVPAGYILIRQNNKTFIVGNCPAYYMNEDKWNTFKSRLTASGEEETEVSETTNTPADWAATAWEKAKEKGVMDGTRPYDNITRQEVAVILDRLGLLGE